MTLLSSLGLSYSPYRHTCIRLLQCPRAQLARPEAGVVTRTSRAHRTPLATTPHAYWRRGQLWRAEAPQPLQCPLKWSSNGEDSRSFDHSRNATTLPHPCGPPAGQISRLQGMAPGKPHETNEEILNQSGPPARTLATPGSATHQAGKKGVRPELAGEKPPPHPHDGVQDMAERVGFEPTVRVNRTTAFEIGLPAWDDSRKCLFCLGLGNLAAPQPSACGPPAGHLTKRLLRASPLPAGHGMASRTCGALSKYG
jgi:hypothetical protein